MSTKTALQHPELSGTQGEPQPPPRGRATMELFNCLSDLTPEIEESSPSSPDSASSTEDVPVGLRRSLKYSFYHLTIFSVKVSRAPPTQYRVQVSPPEPPENCQNLFEALQNLFPWPLRTSPTPMFLLQPLPDPLSFFFFQYIFIDFIIEQYTTITFKRTQ